MLIAVIVACFGPSAEDIAAETLAEGAAEVAYARCVDGRYKNSRGELALQLAYAKEARGEPVTWADVKDPTLAEKAATEHACTEARTAYEWEATPLRASMATGKLSREDYAVQSARLSELDRMIAATQPRPR